MQQSWQGAILATFVAGSLIVFLYSKVPLGEVNSVAAPRGPITWESTERITAETQPDIPHVYSDQWVVVTTINAPTTAIRSVAAMTQWKVVVVGDTKTPKDWQMEGVVFLGIPEQKRLGYRIHDLLPYRSYARKNLGYLYAIQHGARVIYEFDDDNILLVPTIETAPCFDVNLTLAASGQLLEFEARSDRTVVNPYVYFGQPSMWPRGYPLDAIALNTPEASYLKADSSARPLIQQGLANGDPDVDAIFRLTRVSKGRPIRVEFDGAAQPIALPRGTMCPYNAQTTLHHYDAFWALMMPFTPTFRVTDIWRSYWGQRLLYEIGGRLAFFPACVRQDRNVHDYFVDAISETDLYYRARPLVDFLLAWNCTSPSFFTRVLTLSVDMAASKFWGMGDVKLTQAWLQDLVAVGYQPPPLLPPQSPASFSELEVEQQAGRVRVEFHVKNLPSSFLDTPLVANGGVLHRMAEFEKEQVRSLREKFANVVLILNYNFPLFRHSVHFWRAIYSRVFEIIEVVSGEEGDEALNVTGVPDAANGFMTYRILPAIMDRYPLAAGYLVINDDSLLNYWNLRDADLTKIWFAGEDAAWISELGKVESHWHMTEATQSTVAKAYEMIPLPYLVKLRTNLKSRSVAQLVDPEKAYIKIMTDVYYIPNRYVVVFKELAQYFLTARVFSEIALSSIFWILDHPSEFDPTALKNVFMTWGQQREDPWKTYTTTCSAYHPWKARTAEDMVAILTRMGNGDPTLLELIPSICYIPL